MLADRGSFPSDWSRVCGAAQPGHRCVIGATRPAAGNMLTRIRLELLRRFGFPDLWLRWPVSIGRLAVAMVSDRPVLRSEEHTSELQSLMRPSYAVLCLKQK